MNSIVLFRIFKNGFTNFWRNIWLSIAATLVMTITLVILTILIVMFVVTSYSVNTIKERVDISAYFKVGLVETQVLKVKTELERDDRIKEISYISPEDALEEFKKNHGIDSSVGKSIGELNENPLPATLRIKTKNLDQYPEIANLLKSDRYLNSIDQVNFEDNRIIIDRLNQLLNFIITIGSGLLAIFGLIAVLVIFNTITLTIYNRREEIEIMRLVGATNWYIRMPFIIEASLYSLVATAITSILFVPIYFRILPQINEYLNQGGNIFEQPFLNPLYIIGMMIIVSLALSIFSTVLSMRKYLRI